MAASFEAENHMRLAFLFPIEELRQFSGARLNLPNLRRGQLHLPAGVSDSHGSPKTARCVGTRRRLLPRSSLVSGRNFHVLAVLGDSTPRDIDPLPLEQGGDLIVRERTRAVF